MKSPVIRLFLIALNVIALDQVTKWMVTERLALDEQREWVEGFFRLVHWGNTGAAWSMFRGNNHILAGVAIIAVVVLFMARRQFDAHRPIGQIALGLMFGGIIGNLIDRFRIGHVVDFIYFFTYRKVEEKSVFQPSTSPIRPSVSESPSYLLSPSKKTWHPKHPQP